MGRDKLTLPVGGVPLLALVLKAVGEAGCDPILLITPWDYAHLGPAVEASGTRPKIVPNPNAERGRATSVRVGLGALDPAAGEVMITPADLPFLDPKTIRRLIEHYWRDPAIVYPRVEGRKGHPVIIPRNHFPLLAALRGDGTLAPYMKANPEMCRPMECADRGCLIDIDTPDEARRHGIDPRPPVPADPGGANERR